MLPDRLGRRDPPGQGRRLAKHSHWGLVLVALSVMPRAGRGRGDPGPRLVFAQDVGAPPAAAAEHHDSHPYDGHDDHDRGVELVVGAVVAGRGHDFDAAAGAGDETLAGPVGGDLV